LRIRRELHVPLIFVTHDADEMRAIADRVLTLDSGRVAEGHRVTETQRNPAST
jgi:ABC-type molybdate transport system ATPase subunit